MKRLIFLAALGLAVTGCAGNGGGAAASSDAELANLMADAENEIKLASKAGFLWNKTEDHLKAAKEAEAKGDIEGAKKAAQKAIKEARLAQQQAKDQTNAKPPF